MIYANLVKRRIRIWVACTIVSLILAYGCAPNTAEPVGDPRENLFDLFQLPAECPSLCWWTIKPGEPIEPHLQKYRQSSEGISNFRELTNSEITYHSWIDDSGNVQVFVNAHQGIVTSMQIILGNEPEFISSEIWSEIQPLPNFVEIVGEPDTYSVSYQGSREQISRRVEIALNYEDVGIAVTFYTPTQDTRQEGLQPQTPQETSIGSLFFYDDSSENEEWVETIGLLSHGIYEWSSVKDIPME